MNLKFNELKVTLLNMPSPEGIQIERLQKILGVSTRVWNRIAPEYSSGYVYVKIEDLETVISMAELAKLKSEENPRGFIELLSSRSIDILAKMNDVFQVLMVWTNDPFFLEMAWENLKKGGQFMFKSENNFIVRVLLKTDFSQSEESSKFNIVIFAAFSYDDPYLGVVSLKDISPDLKDELNRLVKSENAVLTKAIFNASEKYDKVSGVYILPHTSKQIFTKTDLSVFNILHFMGHGIVDKGISLESSGDDMPVGWENKNPVNVSDWINDGVVEKIIEGSPFKLLVLSACESAMPGDSGSLVFKCLSRGNSEHAIAFRKGISSKLLPHFWEEFYTALMSEGHVTQFKTIEDSDKIVEAYWIARKAVMDVPDYWDSPTIYLTKQQ